MKKIISAVLVLLMAVGMTLAFSGCAQDDTLVCGVTIFDNMNEAKWSTLTAALEIEFII